MGGAGTGGCVGVAVSVVLGCLACTGDESAGEPAAGPPRSAPSRIVLTPTAHPRTSQAFTWRTSTGVDGAVQIRRSGKVRTFPAHARDVSFPGWEYDARQHSVAVRGLRADSAYRYRVGTAGSWSRWMRFRTAQGRKQPWTFAYFGDAQQGLTKQWPRTVDRALRGRRGVDLMVQVGDLVDAPTDDGQWSDWFRALAPYRKRIDTLSAVGNHELIDDPGLAQYRSHFRFPRNGPDGREETTYAVDYQGVRFIVLDSNHLGDDRQRRFLRRKLRHAGGRWKVVVFHKPMYSASVGRHSGPQRRAWLRILERHRADLVLQGHDHAYARGFVRPRASAAAGPRRRPMYAVSVAGGKYYRLQGFRDNDWTRHDAKRVEAEGRTSTYQLVRVTRKALTYRSVISVDGPGGEAGTTIDRFRLAR